MQAQTEIQRAFREAGISSAGMSNNPRVRAHAFHYFFSPAEEKDVRDRRLGYIEHDGNEQRQVGILVIPRAKILPIETVTTIRRSDDVDMEAGIMEQEEKTAWGIAQELDRAYSREGALVLWGMTGTPPDAMEQIEGFLLHGYESDRLIDLIAFLDRVKTPDFKPAEICLQELRDACAKSLLFCDEFYKNELNKMKATVRTGKGPTVAGPRLRAICYQLGKETPDDLEEQIAKMKLQQPQIIVQSPSAPSDGLERRQCGWCGEQVALINGRLPIICKSCRNNPREAPVDEDMSSEHPSGFDLATLQQEIAPDVAQLDLHEAKDGFTPDNPFGETLADKEEPLFDEEPPAQSKSKKRK